MTATIEDEVLGSPDEDDTELPESNLWVCPYDIDGKVCGKSYDAKTKLNAHSMAVHRMTWDGKPVAASGRKAGVPQDGKGKNVDVPPTTTKTTAKKATKSVSPIITDANRAQVYEQSLQMIGLMGHLAAGRYFDTYDHNVWANGSPGLANALNDVGDDNENFRRVCDTLLAGGGGGAYVKLIMAGAMIAVPIAAHHGWLPESAGQRFGAMIGVMGAAPGPEPASGVAPSDANATMAPGPTRPPGNPSEWTYEQWQEILFAVPQSETAMRVMMDMAGPAVGAMGVTIPDMPGTEPITIPTEEHRGTVGTNGGEPAETGSSESVPASAG